MNIVGIVMGVAFSGGKKEVAYASVDLVFAVIGAICSIIVLYLIRRLQMKNGHILLIWTMTLFQLLYDVTLFNATVSVGNGSFLCFCQCLNLFGGAGSALVSNVIAFVSFYVVTFGKVIDIRKNYPLIVIITSLPGAIVVILLSVSCAADDTRLQPVATTGFYFYLRLASILGNFLICTATASQIYYKRANEKRISASEQALRKLAMRLVYYPVVQAVSRSAVAWYEMVYGWNFDPSHTSQSQFIGQIFFAILTPSASYGYLAIFLLMQPKAWECFKCMLQCKQYIAKRTADNFNATNASSLARMDTNGTGNTLHRESTLYPSTAVYEVDSRPSYGGGGGGAMSFLTESSLNEMDEDELMSVALSFHSYGGAGAGSYDVELREARGSEIAKGSRQ